MFCVVFYGLTETAPEATIVGMVEEPVEAEVPVMKKPASKKPSKATAATILKTKLAKPTVAKAKAKAKTAPTKGKDGKVRLGCS